MKDCPSCGKELPDNAQCCRYCGYDQTTIIKINREAKQTLSPSAGVKPPDVPIGDSHPLTPTTSHKAVGKLSMPVMSQFQIQQQAAMERCEYVANHKWLPALIQSAIQYKFLQQLSE